MTRKYAIELIKQEILDADDEYRYETQSVADYYEALEYAVKSLECEKSMIDRVLEIIDERISLLDEEHEGDAVVVVRLVLQDLADEIKASRG